MPHFRRDARGGNTMSTANETDSATPDSATPDSVAPNDHPEVATNDEKLVEDLLKVDTSITSPSACVREVVVTIPEAEVKRYMKQQYDEIVPEAQLPGFRSGRAPRRLVEKQFKDRVVEQVKNKLLMDSLSRVTETDEFSAIGEPDFEYESIKVPDQGDFKYQFQIEVRPDFETPQWKGMPLEKPVEQIGDEQLDTALQRVLSRYSTYDATDEPAKLGDRLLVDVTFKHGSRELSKIDEDHVTLADKVTFSDGVCENFCKVMVGVTEDDVRTVQVKLSENMDDELAGQTIDAEVKVIEVGARQLPELSEEFLQDLGDFASEDELREFIKDQLTRQATYRTNQSIRKSVAGLLTDAVQFELPAKLVRSQTNRELQRKILELRSSGFDEDFIRSFVNSSRQNAQASTELALREHFILEQIAEDEKIDAEESDYELEIEKIAEQSDQPVRRVRARLEKNDQMDALRNQIVEQKVIDHIVENAAVNEKEIPYPSQPLFDEFAIYHEVLRSTETETIPEAKYDDNKLDSAEKTTESKD